MVMNFHNLLDWLQDIKFRRLKLLSPPLYTAPVLCISEQDRSKDSMIQMQELLFFSEKDVFTLTLWEVKDEKGLESAEGKE